MGKRISDIQEHQEDIIFLKFQVLEDFPELEKHHEKDYVLQNFWVSEKRIIYTWCRAVKATIRY